MAPVDAHAALHEHYSSLFSFQDPLAPLPFLTSSSPDFTEVELRDAVQKGAMGKSVVENGISLELLRSIAEVDHGSEELLRWFNSLLHNGDLPEPWHQSAMVLLPKLDRSPLAKHGRYLSVLLPSGCLAV